MPPASPVSPWSPRVVAMLPIHSTPNSQLRNSQRPSHPATQLPTKLVLDRDANPLQGIALLLVVVAIEQVVHAEQHRMVGMHPVHRAHVGDDEIRIVDHG